jgi:uncharacterized protein (TIGR00661 family)
LLPAGNRLRIGRDMARILYSCCGEGQGHSSRVLTVTRALTRFGHEVKILASHKAFKVLQPRLPDVQEIPGFTFVYQNNRVELIASFWGNLPLVRHRRRIIRDITKPERFSQIRITGRWHTR